MPSLTAPLPVSPKTNDILERSSRLVQKPNQAKRMGMMALGILSLAVGFVFFLIPPIPLGMPLFAIGCTLMMKSSSAFQAWALKRTVRLPKIHAFVLRQQEELGR